MSKIENIEKFSKETVKSWKRKDFVNHFEERFSNAGDIYDAYSFILLPTMGECVANDAESYRYLAESIRRHPDQKTLLKMMNDAGFEDSEYFNLCGGIVALHRGYKY